MNEKELVPRLRYIGFFALALLMVIIMRLAFIQILQSDMYQTQAKENRVRLVAIKAPRGEILMNGGEVLAGNELVYTVNLVYTDVPEDSVEDVTTHLVELISPYDPDVTEESVQEMIEAQSYKLYDPIVICRDLPWDGIVKIEENRENLPGVSIGVEPFRIYYNGSLCGHVLGYINSISPEELEAAENAYSINSLVGKAGVEKGYESELRGHDGAQRIEVDASGSKVGELVTKEPQPGNNIYLTLDYKLQLVLESSLQQVVRELQYSFPKAKAASAVVINVKTGEILAMASYPLLNPDDFKGNMEASKAEYYFPQEEEYDPLNPGAAANRAIQFSYPPGSAFKPITGMAALEYGGVDPVDDYVHCAGKYWITPFIKCTAEHGSVNYYEGMAQSCNTYFQEIGRIATKTNIIKVAEDFGLGKVTGVDLPYETKGLLPTPEWKKELGTILAEQQHDAMLKNIDLKWDPRIEAASSEEEKAELEKDKARDLEEKEAQYQFDYSYKTEWQQYDTFNMSIGQGSNQYTVLQMANYVATLANGGHYYKPHVVSRIVTHEGKVTKAFAPELVREVSVSDRTLRETRDAMRRVTEPGGTAGQVFAGFPISVCAKTGTAETGRVGDDHENEFHGVFVAFAPYNDPEIAFASIVEYGQHGSTSAGLICRAVFEQYFDVVDHYSEAQQVLEANKTPEQVEAALKREQSLQSEQVEE